MAGMKGEGDEGCQNWAIWRSWLEEDQIYGKLRKSCTAMVWGWRNKGMGAYLDERIVDDGRRR
jgi:hypothetical protein